MIESRRPVIPYPSFIFTEDEFLEKLGINTGTHILTVEKGVASFTGIASFTVTVTMSDVERS